MGYPHLFLVFAAKQPIAALKQSHAITVVQRTPKPIVQRTPNLLEPSRMQNRQIALEGGSNMRDLGGWALPDGRRMRSGWMFRAASLSSLNAVDHGRLRGLNLATVIDLRSPGEQRDSPSRLPRDLTVIAPGDPGTSAQPGPARNRRPHTEAEAIAMMQHGYETYPDRMAPAIAALFQAAAHSESAPLLFHCTAGKDRTGFVAAIVLKAFGAGDDRVMADYLATNTMWDRKSSRMSFLPKPALEAILQAKAEYLTTALDTVARQHGTVETYLADRCSVSRDTLEAARHAAFR
jgi:protein-tyrosine phosphatase